MTVGTFLMGILPSAGVLALFVFVMRGIFRADRNEREAIARYEAEMDAKGQSAS